MRERWNTLRMIDLFFFAVVAQLKWDGGKRSILPPSYEKMNCYFQCEVCLYYVQRYELRTNHRIVSLRGQRWQHSYKLPMEKIHPSCIASPHRHSVVVMGNFREETCLQARGQEHGCKQFSPHLDIISTRRPIIPEEGDKRSTLPAHRCPCPKSKDKPQSTSFIDRILITMCLHTYTDMGPFHSVGTAVACP